MSALPTTRGASLAGARMTAEQFFAQPDDGNRYELVHGVVVLSPSPVPRHGQPLQEIIRQLENYLDEHPVGFCYYDMDVFFGQDEAGEDIVYRPDALFLRNETTARVEKRVIGVPDTIVEVISPEYRKYDAVEKRRAYERLGVPEYWLIDPERETFLFLRLAEGTYVEVAPDATSFHSIAVPGFALDLDRIRRRFKRWRPGQ